ncbi:KIF-binding protein-like isoform X2 [Symsagittifera roscoffensis]|uniref:KIF-binding protein-like isoform X2 n=1 Tax=Symsagittifera roscoffensis TaxID=84072 RepID=UPI00307C71CC
MDQSELVSDCQEKFKVVLELIEGSKNDPEEEPYKSRYAANEILNELKIKLSSAVKGNNGKESHLQPSGDCDVVSDGVPTKEEEKVHVALALVQYYLSLNYLETEEFSQALATVEASLSTLSPTNDPELTVSLQISCLNQKAVLKSRNDEESYYEEALSCLTDACMLYRNWSSENSSESPPFTFEHILKPDQIDSESKNHVEKLCNTFETLHTTTLYLLAQVWRNLGKKLHSTLACYVTLKRLSESSRRGEKVDWVDWALNSATLSQCFVTDEMFSEGRLCLNSAYCALEKLNIKLEGVTESEEDDKEILREKVEHCKADVDRCCVKYAINLLNASATFATIPEQEMRNRYKDSITALEELTICSFDINKPLIRLMEDCFSEVRVNFEVTSDQVNNFEEARQLFLFGQSKCNQAKLFFTEEQYCRDYIDLCRDHSQLFKSLALYEPDLQRRISMNKKRTDLLAASLDNLNPTHYLQVCRQLQYELGETFSDTADLQKEFFKEQKDVSVGSAKKINSSISKSMKYFREFLKTFEDINGKQPEQFPEMYVRPALMANFYLARLLSKVITSPTIKAENIEKSGRYYQFISDYCDKYESAREQMKAEYPICKEMSMLTPAKKQASLAGAQF